MRRILTDHLVGRRRYQAFFERLHRFSLRGLHYGVGSDLGITGEPQLVERLARTTPGPYVVYDVGAHVGEYAAMVIERLSPVSVICVEPSPTSAAALRARFATSDSVQVLETALGATVGSAPLHADVPGSSQSSLYERRSVGRSVEVADNTSSTVPVTTLDELVARAGTPHINLLKLDVEGSEMDVLRGASGLLAAGRVDIIQFEFGGTNLDARTCLRDFFDLLGDGYAIHRLLRDGLSLVDPWSELWEIYTMNHYVAVRR